MTTHSFREDHKFHPSTKAPEELLWWETEYRKRNFLLLEHDLCYKIYIASAVIHNRVKELDEIKNLDTILEFILEKYIGFRYCQLQLHSGDIIFKIEELLKDCHDVINFLIDMSKKYSMFANKLIIPNNMSKAIKEVKDGKSVANMKNDRLCIIKNDYCSCITTDADDQFIFDDTCKVNINIELTSKNFDFDEVMKEIGSIIVRKRAWIKKINKNIQMSNAEIQLHEIMTIPHELEKIREVSSLRRAYGLWCFDRCTGILSQEAEMFYNGDAHIDSNTFKKLALPPKQPSIRELLHELVRLGLYRGQPKGGKACIDLIAPTLNSKGKELSSKQCGCKNITNCEQKLRSAFINAKNCVKNKSVERIVDKQF